MSHTLRNTPHPSLVWLLGLLVILSACEESPAVPLLGERCAPTLTLACAEGLVCVDGLCRLRATTPDAPTPSLPPTATFDVIGPTAHDTAPTQDSAALDLDLDTGPVIERITLTSHDPERPAETRLTLAVGQAAVMEVFIPVESHPEHLRLTVWRPDAPACGLFRPLVWLPRPLSPEGAESFGNLPDLIGVARPISTTPDGSTVATLPFPEDLADTLGRGPHRVGARYEGPCTANAVSPFIQLDASGDTSRTWLWAEAWIPGSDLGLPGRWAFALQLRLP